MISFFVNLSVWQWVGGILVLILALVSILIAGQLNRRVESDVERSYSRLAGWASWLGVFLRPADTPYERADRITVAVPDGKVQIRKLIQQFVLKEFSRQQAPDDGFDSLEEWRQLRPIFLRHAVIYRLQRWQKRYSGKR